MRLRSGLWLCCASVMFALTVAACGSENGSERPAGSSAQDPAEPASVAPAEQGGPPPALAEAPAESDPHSDTESEPEVVAADGSEPAAALAEAGCELFAPAPSQTTPQINHVLELPEGFEYNTFPPSQGPHHPDTVPFNLYTEPVPQLRLVHNLEHGGLAVQYGDQVSATEIAAIEAWWASDPNGLVVAPLPELEANVALTAWTTEEPADYENSVGRLAYCTGFDQSAFDAFKVAFRGKGPERIPISVLTPGSSS